MAVVVLVGTAKGAAVLRSDETRGRWSVDALHLPGWIVTAAARDDRGRYYAGVTSDVYGAAIVASDDLRSWRQLDHVPRYLPTDTGNAEHNRIIRASSARAFSEERRHVDQIWKLHAPGDVLFAGVSEAGLFRSRDRGGSWEPLTALNEHPSRPNWIAGFGGLGAHAILVDANTPSRMWVGISAAGVFRSDDGGESWQRKDVGIRTSEGCCVHSLAHDPRDADVIYRQDHHGMYLTVNGGDSWELIETGLPPGELSNGLICAYGFASAFDPRTRTAFAVPLAGDNFRYPLEGRLRVYRTRNRGAGWEPNARGLPDDCYANVLRGAMSIDHADPCGVYLGTTAGNVYVSRDVGESWTALPVTLPKILTVAAFEV